MTNLNANDDKPLNQAKIKPNQNAIWNSNKNETKINNRLIKMVK